VTRSKVVEVVEPAARCYGLPAHAPPAQMPAWFSGRCKTPIGSLVSMLRASVTVGEAGRLIMLSGEADLTNAGELGELVTGQLADGTVNLTVDVGGLDFADTAAIRVLLLAAKTLRQRGGGLVVLRPQRALARMLEIFRADEVMTIREEPETIVD
jgi:stage II sporulation protein AA (anti-sigma F factor antagonist)